MDDLIELARLYGGNVTEYSDTQRHTLVEFSAPMLANFASAIRARERVRCAALADTFAAPIYLQATEDESGPEAEALTEILRHELYAPLAAAIRSME